MTRTLSAPSSRAASAKAFDGQITNRARRSTARASVRIRFASSTSVPQSWTTNGRPRVAATSPLGSQCAWIRSASPARRAAARRKLTRNAGSRAARHGCRRRFPMIPAPYAIP